MFLFCLTLMADFAAGAAVVLGLQWYLIKHEKKARWILPVLLTIFTIISSAHGQWWYHGSSGIREILVWDDNNYVGILQTAIDDERQIHAVGRLIIGETEEELDYVDLDFKNGRLVGTEEALQYGGPIMEALGRAAKGFTGSSVSYEELTAEQDKIGEPVRGDYNWQRFIQQLIATSIIPVIAWIMVCRDFRKKSRQKQLHRIEITDL